MALIYMITNIKPLCEPKWIVMLIFINPLNTIYGERYGPQILKQKLAFIIPKFQSGNALSIYLLNEIYLHDQLQ